MKYNIYTKNLHLHLIFLIVILSGCSVKFVSDFDSKTYEESLRIAQNVDEFYGHLLEQPDTDRAYIKYSEQYVQIESELRTLFIRNKSRPLNDESTKISKSILDLWIKYKNKHKTKNTYKTGNAKLDRNRFVRLFISAVSAEVAKNTNPNDTDVSKNSEK